jgi:hypothetical protein
MVNRHEKADKLEIYNNKEEYTQCQKRPRKPRKRKYDLEGDYQACLREWEPLPHEQVIKLKGNALTQNY